MSTNHQRGGRRAAAPASGTDGRSPTGRRSTRSRTAMVGGVALGLTTATLAGMPAQAIDSNPPTGPGNIEVFTKRDMVGLFGYTEYAGRTAEIKVLRNGSVVGSARGTVDGTGFLEVNHAGALCWGDGTNLQVTPDIRGGDEVRVDFLDTGGRWDATAVKDVRITEVLTNDEDFTLTLDGEYGAGVDMPGTDLLADPGKFAIEIVNPDMRGGTSAIGERAIGWPVAAGEVTPGYVVTGSATGTDEAGGTFSVTFDFETATDLDLALAGEHIAMAWQADHPDPDQEGQLGLTVWENGEAPGPAMGGCPAGPQEMRPVAPSEYTGQGAGGGRIAVTWGAGATVPEAPAITGYSVTAVRPYSDGAEAGGVVRVGESGRSVTVEGLTPDEIYTVEIASRSDAGDSTPVIMRVRAGDPVVPGATASTERVPNADGKYAPLVTTAAGVDYGVHLDPVPGLIDAEVHYTTDGSVPTLESPTFVSGESESLQIRQDTTVRWIVVDSGNIVGPQGSQFFDIIESTDPAPAAPSAAAAPVSGAVDVTIATLTDPAVNAYRVTTYTGDSVDVATGVRVGTPVNVLQPDDPTTVTQVVRRVVGLTNGTPYKFTVAARYGNVWSDESGLSVAVAPEAASKADAGPDQTVLRGRTFTLDGSFSPKAVSYQWTQIRPTTANNGGLPQDPALDLNPAMAGIQATTGAVTEPTLQLTFPLLTTPTSDHDLQFRLRTEHSDGLVRADLVTITGQGDTIVADEVRWRDGDEIGGTGSQENARLTLHNGGPTGPVIGETFVTNGAWEFAGGAPALVNDRLYVWSDYGFTATITTTD